MAQIAIYFVHDVSGVNCKIHDRKVGRNCFLPTGKKPVNIASGTFPVFISLTEYSSSTNS
jgi:hypothetical protein